MATLSTVGCSDFLEPIANGTFDEEDFWDYPSYVEGLVGEAYTLMPTTYANNRGFYLDGATDDAVITTQTNAMNRFGTGSLSTSSDPFKDDIYTNSYNAIVSVNRFLKDDRGLNTTYSTDATKNELIQNRLQGEAFGLRAWYEWELLKYYGGVGAKSGDLLGISIVTDAFDDLNSDALSAPRSTYEETMTQIESDVEAACSYLPIAHRDALIEDLPTDEAGATLWGTLDQMTLNALLSQMYLTYASPLFNPNSVDAERWKKAADQALKVIAMKRSVDGAWFDETMATNWNDPNYIGIIFASQYTSADLTTENAFYPASVSGTGAIGATQELVDSFPMENGYPINDYRSDYDPQYPYRDRDPRLYSVIYHNGAVARISNTGDVIHEFEAWTGKDLDGNDTTGEDYAGSLNTSLTNYHIKKFIYMNYDPYTSSKTTGGPRSKYFYRWAHMLLNFAEAANEYYGPDKDVTIDGVTMSAKSAIKALRSRTTYDGESMTFGADPYLDEMAKDKDTMRELIRNERRLETCFEGMRYFDLRRWSQEDDLELLNTTIHRPEIERDPLYKTFTYTEGTSAKPHVEIGRRVFTTPYIPLPYDEILRVPEIEQNKGWESWM